MGPPRKRWTLGGLHLLAEYMIRHAEVERCEMSSWLRLDADFLDDARLWDAGWESTLIWPALLALLKQHDGVLDDRTFSSRYLARKIGCPGEIAERGIIGIRESGLLVRGSATWKVHQGIEQSREGWLSPRWSDKRNAPPSWEVQTMDGATVGNHGQPSRGLDVDAPSLEPDAPSLDTDSRAGADAHAVSSRNVTSRSEKTREKTTTDWRPVWEAWRESNPTARKSPTSGQRATIKARLRDYSVEDLSSYFRWLRESPHKRALFCRSEGHDGWTSVMRPTNVDERMPWVSEWTGGGSVQAPKAERKGESYPRWLEEAVMQKIPREGLRREDLTIALLQAHPRIGEVSESMQREVLDLCLMQMGWSR